MIYINFAIDAISVHVMANALSVMVNVLDVAHLVVIRCGDSRERREKRGAGNQGEQADSGLENGVHDSALACENSVGWKQKPALYRRVFRIVLHGCNGRSAR